MKTRVFCRTRFEGFHRWPEAPEEVGFLRSLHRHEFHVEVTVDVDHDDRDVEFILLKRQTDQAIERLKHTNDTKSWSCERWAQRLLHKLNASRVVVSEDGENGAVVTR